MSAHLTPITFHSGLPARATIARGPNDPRAAPPHHDRQSIIFIRDRNVKGQEVSGYLDYAHRLKTENFEPYFDGRKKVTADRRKSCVSSLCVTRSLGVHQ
jgi:hypothetical protein